MASESLVVKSYKEAETSTASTTKSHGSRFEEYQIYQGVMGRPGIDFPVFPQIPATSFSCRGVKKSGYYADLETDCQVFHICDGNRKISFLCPNGTIFRQSHLICDWWFRVDCGKSVELYEESAEQLAADQKIYKARSEERERRRKLGKAAGEGGEELTSSEVYALDEPFYGRSRKEQGRQAGGRGGAGVRSEGRKGERHSKKVVDAGMTEKFPSYSREKASGGEKVRGSRPGERQGVASGAFVGEARVEEGAVESTPGYKGRYQTPNSIGGGSNKENIQPAESGSLVEDLNQRNFGFGLQSGSNNNAYNRKVNQTAELSNQQQQSQPATNNRNNGVAQNEQNNRNINFSYGRTRNEQTEDNTAQTHAFDSGSQRGEQNDFGVTAYTTEFFNYESRRTNPVERQETVTPTFQTAKTQSSRYRSSTPPPAEQERQFFAETASFASNRGGKSFSDFQNTFNTFGSGATPTASPKTTFYTTSQRADTFPTTYTTPNLNQHFHKTSTYRPVKQHSRKVTAHPSTQPHTTFPTRLWPTTTSQPLETTTNDRFTLDDVYFTTSTPDPERLTDTNLFEDLPHSTASPDLDISLQELNINKTPQPPHPANNTYEDLVRQGLEVPPSSGPNAIRTFALYFATTNTLLHPKTTPFLPSNDSDLTTLTPFEIKKKELVKQVDDIVQKTSLNASDPLTLTEHLPNSLTPHTKHSYSALFPPHTHPPAPDTPPTDPPLTTPFDSFTEQPNTINTHLTNDLDPSQTRGLLEPDPHPDPDHSKVSPDLRELAQVFTKALSAYLDDPEAFRRVLSEIRPTEPSDLTSPPPADHPSATQDDDEVLDFSDVTNASHRKKTPAPHTTTDLFTDPPTTTNPDSDNFVLPLNHSSWATNLHLTAPLLETLDQSQTTYYTPPSYLPTTNAIAEEINNEFTPTDPHPSPDSYLPLRGSVDDPSLPRYGGFHNNSHYSPYGAELTSTPPPPTTFNPHPTNDSQHPEIQLANELNNLVLLQKFTTPRGTTTPDTTTPDPTLPTSHNDLYRHLNLGNGHTLEQPLRTGKTLRLPEPPLTSNHFDPDPSQINLHLSPPPTTPKGFLITYSLPSPSTRPPTYLPSPTTPPFPPTTFAPTTFAPTNHPPFENFSQRLQRLTRTSTAPPPPTTLPTSAPPLQRLAHLQETLMFSSNNLTLQQRHQARLSVEHIIDSINMTDSTANTLMKVMEMAAKNETYRRLVLLLVNDKSGRNKTVHESRLALLKALLTPVVTPPRALPIPDTSRLAPTDHRRPRTGARRSNSLPPDPTTPNPPPSTTPPRKPTRGLTRAESTYSLGNLGLIRRTIDNSKNTQQRANSLDDAILDSDSRAVDLLRSLYSLAARWG